MKKHFGLKYFRHLYSFPCPSRPLWGEKVDRWHQLDAYSFGLIDAFYHYQAQLETPDMMLFASPYASNDADYQFVLTNAKKPAKMVHTLPNVRCTPLIKYMDWTGPVLCLQKDPQTRLTALLEGLDLLDSEYRHLLIWSAINCQLMENFAAQTDSKDFAVDIFSLIEVAQGESGGTAYPYLIQQESRGPIEDSLDDKRFIHWLLDKQSLRELSIHPGIAISKNNH